MVQLGSKVSKISSKWRWKWDRELGITRCSQFRNIFFCSKFAARFPPNRKISRKAQRVKKILFVYRLPFINYVPLTYLTEQWQRAYWNRLWAPDQSKHLPGLKETMFWPFSISRKRTFRTLVCLTPERLTKPMAGSIRELFFNFQCRTVSVLTTSILSNTNSRKNLEQDGDEQKGSSMLIQLQ